MSRKSYNQSFTYKILPKLRLTSPVKAKFDDSTSLRVIGAPPTNEHLCPSSTLMYGALLKVFQECNHTLNKLYTSCLIFCRTSSGNRGSGLLQVCSLIPRPLPRMRERGSGYFSQFPWHSENDLGGFDQIFWSLLFT